MGGSGPDHIQEREMKNSGRYWCRLCRHEIKPGPRLITAWRIGPSGLTWAHDSCAERELAKRYGKKKDS